MKRLIIPFLISFAIILVSFAFLQSLELYFENWIQSSRSHGNVYTSVSFIILVSDVALPVPSTIVMFTNGAVLGFPEGMLLSLIAVMLGACIGYLLGRFSSMGVGSKKDEVANNLMHTYGSMAILISRGIPMITESINVTLGYNKMPFGKYMVYNFIGYIPVCALYSWFGSIGYASDAFLLCFACSLMIAAIFWVAGRKLARKSKFNYETPG